jgi:hypothetical protein
MHAKRLFRCGESASRTLRHSNHPRPGCEGAMGLGHLALSQFRFAVNSSVAPQLGFSAASCRHVQRHVRFKKPVQRLTKPFGKSATEWSHSSDLFSHRVTGLHQCHTNNSLEPIVQPEQGPTLTLVHSLLSRDKEPITHHVRRNSSYCRVS